MKCVIISGYLYGLSDNIKQFLDKDTAVYIHTWDNADNKRWVDKLKRYESLCSKIIVEATPSKFDKKLYSYFYSTWRSVNLIEDIDKYNTILKFKPNLNSKLIEYTGDTKYYFSKAQIQSRPLLNGICKEECLYGSIYYQTMDERLFTGYPLAFKKSFHSSFKDFYTQMVTLDDRLSKTYGKNYEGSIFWKEWFESKGIKLIQDIDLKLPDNKQQWQN